MTEMKITVKKKISKTGNPFVALCATDAQGRDIIISFAEATIFKLLPNGVGYKDITDKEIIIGELFE